MTPRSALPLSFGARVSLLTPTLLLVGSFFFALAGVVMSSFVTEGHVSLALYEQLLASSVTRGVIIRTMWVAAAVTVLCVFLSYPVALFVARSRHRNLMLVIVISPLLTSVVIRTFAWLVLLGNRGALNALLLSVGLLDAPVRIMFTPLAVVIGLTHIFMPFMIISILAVLQQQDNQLVEAGMSLGAGRLETFARVTLPLSLPGVLSGCSLVYMLCSGAIVTPLLLGGVRDRMLGTQIYEELVELYDFRRAAGLAIVLLLSAVLVVIPMMWCETRIRRRIKG
jgi:putative spermidine/putrescine transport system permease protein